MNNELLYLLHQARLFADKDQLKSWEPLLSNYYHSLRGVKHFNERPRSLAISERGELFFKLFCEKLDQIILSPDYKVSVELIAALKETIDWSKESK